MVQPIDRTAERYMETLDVAERTGKLDDLVALFAEDAEVRSLAQDVAYKGRDGARKFWEAYLSAFGRIHSAFHHVIEGGRGGVALEWMSEGVLPSGDPIEYRGITVLELENGLIKSLRSYYDTAAFVRPVSQSAQA